LGLLNAISVFSTAANGTDLWIESKSEPVDSNNVLAQQKSNSLESLSQQFASILLRPRETLYYMANDRDAIVDITKLCIERYSSLIAIDAFDVNKSSSATHVN